jgi:hypothetical protein
LKSILVLNDERPHLPLLGAFLVDREIVTPMTDSQIKRSGKFLDANFLTRIGEQEQMLAFEQADAVRSHPFEINLKRGGNPRVDGLHLVLQDIVLQDISVLGGAGAGIHSSHRKTQQQAIQPS